MQTHVPGIPARVVFELRNSNGELLEPAALRWRVGDETGVLVQDWRDEPVVAYAELVELQLDAAHTTLAPAALRGARTVELEITLADGTALVHRQVLLLTARDQLQVGVNTFATYAQALICTQDFTSATLTGWSATENRQQQEAALVEAFQAMRGMPLVVAGRDRLWLSDLSTDEYLSYVTDEQKADLMKAQLLEASAILEVDPALIARRKGIMSSTVGEASQFFRTSKPLELPMLSQQAVMLLKPYLRWSTVLARR